MIQKKNLQGLRVLYCQNKKSKLTSFGYMFSFGSRRENKNEYGLFHMLEHNIFKGTENFSDPTEITRFFRERSFDINAMTSYSYTSYYVEGLSEFLFKDDLIKRFTEIVFLSSFPKDEFEKEKNPIMNEYEMYANDTNETFFETSVQKLLGEEFHPILGTRSSIKRMSRDLVYKKYSELYNKSNCFFVIETSKSWKSIERELSKSISLIPQGSKIKENKRSKNYTKRDIRISTGRKVESGILSIYYPIKESKILKEKVLETVILSAIETLIYDKFRDREGIPTYSQSCKILTLGEYRFVNITAFVAPKHTEYLCREIVKFLKNIDRLDWHDKIKKIKMNIAKNFVNFLEDPLFHYIISSESGEPSEFKDLEEKYKFILNCEKKTSKNDIVHFLKVFKKKPTIHFAR